MCLLRVSQWMDIYKTCYCDQTRDLNFCFMFSDLMTLTHLFPFFQIRGPRLLIFLEPPMVNPLKWEHFSSDQNNWNFGCLLLTLFYLLCGIQVINTTKLKSTLMLVWLKGGQLMIDTPSTEPPEEKIVKKLERWSYFYSRSVILGRWRSWRRVPRQGKQPC